MAPKMNEDFNAEVQYNAESYCKYPGCKEERVYKITGELHNFCKYHREKASQNQRRYAQNKRDRKRQKKLVQSTVMTNIYEGQYTYVNPIPQYPTMPVCYPNNYMPVPMNMEFLGGMHSPMYYQEKFVQDDLAMLSHYLLPNQCV